MSIPVVPELTKSDDQNSGTLPRALMMRLQNLDHRFMLRSSTST